MNFIVDAQLPRSLSELLIELGHDSIHTLDLPLKNATSDNEIRLRSVSEKRIVLSKDADFLQSYLVNNIPEKLILIRTGNIRNSALLELFRTHLPYIIELLNDRSLIEITQEEITALN